MGIRDWLAGIAASLSDDEEEYTPCMVDLKQVLRQDQIVSMYKIQALSGQTVEEQINVAVDHFVSSKAFLLRNYLDYYPTVQAGMQNLQKRMDGLEKAYRMEQMQNEEDNDENCN